MQTLTPAPHELAKMNWGAVLAGPIWAIGYGAWAWAFGLWALQAAIGLALFLVFAGALSQSLILDVVATSILVGTYVAVLSLFGMRANGLAWDEKRGAFTDAGFMAMPQPVHSVEKYLTHQRIWIVGGVVLMIMGLDFGVPLKSFLHSRSIAAVLTAAVVLLGVQAFAKQRSGAKIKAPS